MTAWSLRHASVLDALREVPDCSFDALACDPPYGFSFMGKAWDYDVPSVETWRECLRVLKPGAPLVAFGGSRTYHRLACGIEDAGFELRDCLMWLYGKGFPKSLNVGLALDKAAGAERPVVGSRVLTGNAAISTKDKGGTYGVQVLPKKGTCQHCGSNAPYTDWTICESCHKRGLYSTPRSKEVNVTGPATELAQAWDGYGTALKPAWEPIVLARKPLEVPSVNVREHVERELRVRGVSGEIVWKRETVSVAASTNNRMSSSSTEVLQVAETSAASVAAFVTERTIEQTQGVPERPTVVGKTETQAAGECIEKQATNDCETTCSLHTAACVPAAESVSGASSQSIISKAEAARTDELCTERSTLNCDVLDTQPDTESFAGIVTGLTGSLARVHIRRHRDGSFSWPHSLPLYGGWRDASVAANVARWGVGGLAIDACRIGTHDATPEQRAAKAMVRTSPNTYGEHRGLSPEEVAAQIAKNVEEAGRWPANLVLSHTDGCRPTGVARVKGSHAGTPKRGDGTGFVRGTKAGTVAHSYVEEDGLEAVEVWDCTDDCPIRLLDEQAGDRPSGTAVTRNGGGNRGGAVFDQRTGGARPDSGYDDDGGPSRFFFCSKVSTEEREFGCDALPLRSAGEVTDREDDTDGLQSPRAGAGRTGGARNHHPTLKPIGLTTWLARLLLPPSRSGQPRRILVPFAGSGSEMVGAPRAGWDEVVGVEREADYITIAEARLRRWESVPQDMEPAEAISSARAARVDDRQEALFR